MSRRETANRTSRLRAEDWVEAAYRAIAEGGVAAVAVEPLAKQLSVTKGSFYWHFKNRDALLEATLKRWEEEATEAVISAADLVADPRKRLVGLAEEAFTREGTADDATGPSGRRVFLGHAFEQAVSDAANNPVVGPVLQRVTERRIDYLERCYLALEFSPEEASHRALLVYATHAGTLRLLREAPDRVPSGKDYLAYRRHLIATLIPESMTDKEKEGSPTRYQPSP